MPTTKTLKKTQTKRHGHHHRHSKKYKQVYWPYIPLLVISVMIMLFSFIPYHRGKTLAYATEMSKSSLLQATNAERQKNGMGSLALNEQLNAAAQAKAADMAAKNYWSHKTPAGEDPWMFIANTGYAYSKAGENLAYGFRDSSATINGWMNSPTHRANLLDAEFTEAGFGHANVTNYQQNGPETVVVAMYGRPQVLPAGTVSTNSITSGGNTASEQPVRAITKIEALTGSHLPWTSFAIGLLSGAAAVGLFINHSLRLRKFFKKSEQYFVAHPLLDISLIFLVIATIELSTIVGYIR